MQLACHGLSFVVQGRVQPLPVFDFGSAESSLALEFLRPSACDVLAQCDEHRVVDGEVRDLLDDHADRATGAGVDADSDFEDQPDGDGGEQAWSGHPNCQGGDGEPVQRGEPESPVRQNENQCDADGHHRQVRRDRKGSAHARHRGHRQQGNDTHCDQGWAADEFVSRVTDHARRELESGVDECGQEHLDRQHHGIARPPGRAKRAHYAVKTPYPGITQHQSRLRSPATSFELEFFLPTTHSGPVTNQKNVMTPRGWITVFSAAACSESATV